MAFIKELNLGRIYIKQKFSRKNYDENNSVELLENVVQSVNYICKLTDEETGLFEEVSGIVHFQYPENEFIPYDQITKSIILSWLENNETIEYKLTNIKNRLEIRIKEYKQSKNTSITSFDSLPD